MQRLLKAGVALALVGVQLTACKEDESAPEVLLVVETAQQQPARDDLGIIVLVQAKGGKWLEVETRGATLSDGKTTGCFLAPQAMPISQSVTTMLLFPTQEEAVITVRLLPDGPAAAPPAGVAGAGSPSAGGDVGASLSKIRIGPCGISSAPLREVTKPVSRKAVQPPAASAGGASGVGGSNGGSSIAGATSTAGSTSQLAIPSAGGTSGNSNIAGATSTGGTSSAGGNASGGTTLSEAGASSGAGRGSVTGGVTQGIGGADAGSAGAVSVAGGVS